MHSRTQQARPLILLLLLIGLISCGGTQPGLSTSVGVRPSRACSDGETGRTNSGLYYECHGAGDEVVILIPAFSMDVRMWTPQLAVVERLAAVVAYDTRGHGGSASATYPYSSVDDLLGLLDELNVRSAHLIGLSNGARIALDFALVHPTRVTSLVLASPGVSGFTGGDFSYMTPVIAAIQAGDFALAAERWAATPLMHIPDDSAASALIRTISLDNRAIWSYTTNPERQLSPPALDRLSEVSVPVLVITGDEDLPYLRDLADVVVRGIPGARRLVIHGAGHLVNVAEPDAFNRAIEEFLGEQISR